MMRDATKDEQECIQRRIDSISEPIFTKEDLKKFFRELDKLSFRVDTGYSETWAVRLVDIEDILINQFI